MLALLGHVSYFFVNCDCMAAQWNVSFVQYCKFFIFALLCLIWSNLLRHFYPVDFAELWFHDRGCWALVSVLCHLRVGNT